MPKPNMVIIPSWRSAHVGDVVSEEELKGMIDSEIESLNLEEELFAKILNPIFRGKDVDEEDIVKEYLKRIELYHY